MLGRIYNDDAFELVHIIANECVNPVIVTDPPFNIGYHYRTYKDRVNADAYYEGLASIFTEYPSVVVLYPEALHRLSMEMQTVPDRVVSWVYPSNMKRQHRDIGFYGIKPDFEQVRQPYRDMKDKRNKARIAKTGGARSYDWIMANQVKNISREKTEHPCQMPLAVMDIVVGWLPKDVTVIDPFAGSGTTALAAERRGLEWRAIEIDPLYCDIIERRIRGSQKKTARVMGGEQ